VCIYFVNGSHVFGANIQVKRKMSVTVHILFHDLIVFMKQYDRDLLVDDVLSDVVKEIGHTNFSIDTGLRRFKPKVGHSNPIWNYCDGYNDNRLFWKFIMDDDLEKLTNEMLLAIVKTK